MKKNKLIVFIVSLFFFNIHTQLFPSENKINVGLLIVATGKYIEFIPNLIKSAQKFFLKNHQVTFFVFTDSTEFSSSDSDNIIKIDQRHLGNWDNGTMMRFNMYYKNKDLYSSMDYLFACDADSLFLDEMGDDILSDRVGTLHYWMLDKDGINKIKEYPFERNETSTACIKKDEEKYYFAGAFYGGTTAEFLKLALACSNNIQIDLANNVKARWLDESHLNRYFLNNPPTKMLHPSYYLYELVKSSFNYHGKLLGLIKNIPH